MSKYLCIKFLELQILCKGINQTLLNVSCQIKEAHLCSLCVEFLCPGFKFEDLLCNTTLASI